MCVCVYVCVCVFVCVCAGVSVRESVCVLERERERDRESETWDVKTGAVDRSADFTKFKPHNNCARILTH